MALGRKTVVLAGDGGFMLNVGELACAVQEKAELLVLLMNDSQLRRDPNIQDDIYGSRHCYVDSSTPISPLCARACRCRISACPSRRRPQTTLEQALQRTGGPVLVEVDMKAWGPFAAKFAGPILKKE
jgi:acetolactate synthase-1/2/3 large subunit